MDEKKCCGSCEDCDSNNKDTQNLKKPIVILGSEEDDLKSIRKETTLPFFIGALVLLSVVIAYLAIVQ